MDEIAKNNTIIKSLYEREQRAIEMGCVHDKCTQRYIQRLRDMRIAHVKYGIKLTREDDKA